MTELRENKPSCSQIRMNWDQGLKPEVGKWLTSGEAVPKRSPPHAGKSPQIVLSDQLQLLHPRMAVHHDVLVPDTEFGGSLLHLNGSNAPVGSPGGRALGRTGFSFRLPKDVSPLISEAFFTSD